MQHVRTYAVSVLLLGVATIGCSPAEKPAAAPATLGEVWGNKLESLPDWTGSWFIDGCCMFPTREFQVSAPDPAGDAGGFSYGDIPGSYFTGAPFKPEYQKIYDERIRAAREEGKIYDSMGSCMVPHGMPRIIGGGPGPTEFLVTPEKTTIIWDYMNEQRRIYTDGRSHPSREELPPAVMGHSIGHWEGDTLVVDTTLMKAAIYDRSGAPHSDQVHLMERIRRIDEKTIEFQMTIEDPVMLTKPWKVTRLYHPVGNRALEGAYCENNRNPIAADGQTAVLGSEKESLQ
jgi:hypothetical protein